jgi:hypothetical protein
MFGENNAYSTGAFFFDNCRKIGEHWMPAEYMYDKGDKGHPVAMPNISSAKTTLKIVGK